MLLLGTKNIYMFDHVNKKTLIIIILGGYIFYVYLEFENSDTLRLTFSPSDFEFTRFDCTCINISASLTGKNSSSGVCYGGRETRFCYCWSQV